MNSGKPADVESLHAPKAVYRRSRNAKPTRSEQLNTSPRLIEKWLPINEISTEAIRERAAASALPAVNWLHVWWARRPLAASRASVLLSLIPQSADDDDTRHSVFNLLGTSPNIHHIAQRLASASQSGQRDKEGYGNHRRAFTHNPTEQQLTWLNSNLAGSTPVVLDVTAGGGSIPFEAGRLGFPHHCQRTESVACLILRATCEWPQRHGYPLLDDYHQRAQAFQERVGELLAGVYPDEAAPDCSRGTARTHNATAARRNVTTQTVAAIRRSDPKITKQFVPKGMPKRTFGHELSVAPTVVVNYR